MTESSAIIIKKEKYLNKCSFVTKTSSWLLPQWLLINQEIFWLSLEMVPAALVEPRAGASCSHLSACLSDTISQ